MNALHGALGGTKKKPCEWEVEGTDDWGRGSDVEEGYDLILFHGPYKSVLSALLYNL